MPIHDRRLSGAITLTWAVLACLSCGLRPAAAADATVPQDAVQMTIDFLAKDDQGFRAIGLENNPELVARGNNAIMLRGLEKEIRFFQGDALDIPLASESFDGLADIGLLHHIHPNEYPAYVSEATRVLKSGGYFFLVVLSKNTSTYFTWHPSKDAVNDYEHEGVQYHFFSDEELRTMFEKDFEIKDLAHDIPYGPKDAVFSVLLLKKK